MVYSEQSKAKKLATEIKKHGSLEAYRAYMQNIGRKGGSKPTQKLKGFAANKELAARVGAVGGAKSRRRKQDEGK